MAEGTLYLRPLEARKLYQIPVENIIEQICCISHKKQIVPIKKGG
jgi:hypothetical protein